MIGDILQPTHLLFILVIALLVLGPKRLPEVGRALGRGLRDFRNAINSDDLRDQMVSTTGTERQAPVEHAPPGAAEAPVGQPTYQPATTPEPASTDEPNAAAPTPERVP